MISKSFTFLSVLSVLGFLVLRTQGLPQQGGHSIVDKLNHYGYEDIGHEKYATVVHGYGNWRNALRACRLHLPGGTLFTVDNARDSNWLGRRINFEKDRVTGASKFWVGMISQSVRGPLLWLTGRAYNFHPEVINVSGYEDRTKQFAWVVPDGLITRLKYEFLTSEDEAEAYICQYINSYA